MAGSPYLCGRSKCAHKGERAIIDIGSNTVPWEVFDGPPRAPELVIDETASAKLGKAVCDSCEFAEINAPRA